MADTATSTRKKTLAAGMMPPKTPAVERMVAGAGWTTRMAARGPDSEDGGRDHDGKVGKRMGQLASGQFGPVDGRTARI